MKTYFGISRFTLNILTLLLAFAAATNHVFGQNDSDAKTSAAALQNEAENLSREWNGEPLRRSAALFLNAAAEWEKADAPTAASHCLREAAELALLFSDYEQAFDSLEKALRLDQKSGSRESKSLTLSLLSRTSNQKGDVKKSENYYQQSLALAKRSNSDAARASALFSAAEYNSAYGSLNETIKFYEEALGYADRAADHDLTAQILINIGYSHTRQDNPVYGLQKVKEALAKWEEIGDKRGQALANFGIGWIYTLTAEKQNALDYYRKAEMMFPDDVDWLERAKVLNGIATIYEEFGETELGENYRRKALELYEKAKFPYGQLPTLISLARISYSKGDKAAAQSYFAKALSLAEQTNDRFHLAVIRENIGNFDLAEGSYDQAIANYRSAAAVYKNLDIVLPRVENRLGIALEKKGDTGKAREFFESALRTNQKIRAIIPSAENLYNLARLNESEGDFETALTQIKESLAITDSVYYDVGNSNLRKNYLSNVFDRYELCINLLMRKAQSSGNSDFSREALQIAEKSRARSMLENLSLAEADFTKDADAEIVRREKEIRVLLNAKADKLTDHLSRRAEKAEKAEKAETERISGEIAELEFQLENIKAQLRRQSPIYSAIKNPAPFDVGEFQKEVLDENSLLLEFSFGAKESYLWLVGKNEIDYYRLPPREQTETHIEKLREILTEREMKNGEELEDYRRRISAAEGVFQSEARRLSSILLGQIADKIGGKRLLVVPDGKLHYFPVSALPLPASGSDEPLLLTNETVYQPSAQTLLVLKRRGDNSAQTRKNLLIFSDPVFSSDDARFPSENRSAENLRAETDAPEQFRFAQSLETLIRLPASKNESDSILAIVGAAQADDFSGFAANREQLLSAKTGQYKILHFATHGLMHEKRPELSALVFSRFDAAGGKRDEFFRIHDIYGLNLNADLVVLSACETAVGKEVRGEGLMSLNNAFLQTGAKSVIASLWKIEDNASLELMKNLYAAMANEKLTAPQALRAAQIKLRENPRYRSPFYWAAFTVQGDFNSVPQISKSQTNPLYLLLLLPLFAAAIYLFRVFNSQKRSISKHF